MKNIFSLKNVSKSYTRGRDEVTIFEGINLDIPEGDFVAIMGPSGSGKSTLLNLLGGIDRASGGEIIYRDARLDKHTEPELTKWRANNVGFIFQSYNLIQVLNAFQNVELPLLLSDLPSQKRKANVQTALEIVNLKDRVKHYPKEMSGGQQQRVAIARALVADPSLLLCDEPTGDLDRKTADEILNIIQLLNQEMGKTIVMVTHDPIAAGYAKRTLKLDKGKFTEGGANA